MDRQTGGSFVWLFAKGHLARKQKYQEPQTLSSGWIKKSENGYLTGYQEDENSPNHVPNKEAFFSVGSWLRSEGFGHPLAATTTKPCPPYCSPPNDNVLLLEEYSEKCSFENIMSTLSYFFALMSTHSSKFTLMSTYSYFFALMSAKKWLCVLTRKKVKKSKTHEYT